MGFTLDSSGKPVFAATPTQTVADLQAAADFAKKYAFTIGLTASQRGLLGAAERWNGLHVYETDTDTEYIYSSGWKLWHRSWRSYTPTLTNSSGTPTVTARYAIASGTVKGKINILLTGTNVGTGLLITVPVTARTPVGLELVGTALYQDVSATAWVLGQVLLQNTTQVAPLVPFLSGTIMRVESNVGAGNPFTWAAGDTMTLEFEYEAA